MKIDRSKEIYKADSLPLCESCSVRDKSGDHILRPNILMFNDYDYNESENINQQMEFQSFMA